MSVYSGIELHGELCVGLQFPKLSVAEDKLNIICFFDLNQRPFLFKRVPYLFLPVN